MKKMRRLIPAIAMLLVSAVMLSTASFAWFTMNQAVTATGMQVQAKATGSLVISNAPLMYNNANTDIDFQDATAAPLTPVTLEEDGTWMTVKNPSAVNSILGTPGIDGMIEAENPSYVEKAVYIGNAGDEDLAGPITVTLTAPVSATGDATKAYAIAVYVAGVVTAPVFNGDNVLTGDGLAAVAVDAEPAAIVWVDSDDSRNTATFTLTGVTIPSIIGVGDQNNNRTGLKLVLRIFADGALTSYNGTRTANTGTYVYTEAESYDSTKQYYVPTGNYIEVNPNDELKAINGETPYGWYLPATTGNGYTLVTKGTAVDTSKTYWVQEFVPANLANLEDGNIPEDTTWYTRAADTVTLNYHYINSQDVPTSGSILSIQFSASTQSSN